jgi:regulatory protein
MEHFEKYLNNSYHFLSIRSRSEKEMRDYLTKKSASGEIIEAVILHLKEHNFLNDETFARSFVLSRARLNPKGKVLLKIELRQKGISDDIIQNVLAEVQEEIPDELAQAKSLIAKRMDRLKGASKNEIYSKVGGFLSRRGFSWQIVKKAIDDSLENRV